MSQRALSESQLDALREAGNVGAGHAATALSDLLGRPVSVGVPSLTVVPVERVPDLFGGAERVAAVAFSRCEGDIAGTLALVAQVDAALRLVGMARSVSSSHLDDQARAVIADIADALGTSYLTAVARLTGLSLRHGPVAVAVDMVAALLEEMTIGGGSADDRAIVLRTRFVTGDGEDVDAHVMCLPRPDSLALLFDRLGVGS
jgi:chemotaxis protein CheC